ncbi:MAG: hypothetical protein R3E48_13710 [Burkholderiaceae bacterium]
MHRFDDWVTDRSIRLDEVRRFISDPARIGEPYRDRYVLWTSSGSTGEPGIFVQDEASLSVYEALLSTRFSAREHAESLWQTLAVGGRMAMLAAIDGHYAGS